MPSFTDLKPGSELFQIVTVEAGEDAADFCRRAKAQAAAQTEFITSGPWDGDQLVYFTCLPWFPLTALKNEKDVNPSDSVPRGGLGPLGGGREPHPPAAEPGAEPPPAGRASMWAGFTRR